MGQRQRSLSGRGAGGAYNAEKERWMDGAGGKAANGEPAIAGGRDTIQIATGRTRVRGEASLAFLTIFDLLAVWNAPTPLPQQWH